MTNSGDTDQLDETFLSGARLKKIRLYLAMTREQFSDALGISKYTIRSWELGKKRISIESAEKVVSSLAQLDVQCSINWIMNGEGISPLYKYEESLLKHDFSYTDNITDISCDELDGDFLRTKMIGVEDSSFQPVAHPGDVIGFAQIEVSKWDKYLDHLVMYEPTTKNIHFGVLQKLDSDFFTADLNGAKPTKISASKRDCLWLFMWYQSNYKSE